MTSRGDRKRAAHAQGHGTELAHEEPGNGSSYASLFGIGRWTVKGLTRNRNLIFAIMMWANIPGIAQIDVEMKVIQRQITVHVLNPKGAPVTGLTADDFRITENGEPRTISLFTSDPTGPLLGGEPDTSQTESSPENLAHWILVLDSSHMTRDMFEAMVNAAKRLIQTRLPPNTLVKLVQLEQRMVHLTEITSDSELMLSALDGAVHQGYGRRTLASLEDKVVTAIEDYLTMKQEEIPTGAIQSFGQSACVTAKVVNALADHVLDAVLEKERFKQTAFRTYYLNMLALADMYKVITAPKTVFLFTGGLHLDAGNRFANTQMQSIELAGFFNHADMTVHAIMLESAAPAGHRGRMNSHLGYLNPNDLLEKLEPDATHGQAARRMLMRPTGNAILENADQQMTGPRSQARHTGGFFASCAKPCQLQDTLDAWAQKIQAGYRLGFDTSSEKRAKIDVTLVRPQEGWKVLFGERLHALPESDKTLRLQALAEMSLLHDAGFRDDIGVSCASHPFPAIHGTFPIPTQIRFSHQGNTVRGYRVGFAALNDQGEPLDLVLSRVTSIPKTGTIAMMDLLLTQEPPRVIRYMLENLDTGERFLGQQELDLEGELHPILISGAKPDMVTLLHQSRLHYRDDERSHRRLDLDPTQVEGSPFLWDPQPELRPGQDIRILFSGPNPDLEAQAISMAIQTAQGPERVTSHIEKHDDSGRDVFIAMLPGISIAPEGTAIAIHVSTPTGAVQLLRPLTVLRPSAADRQDQLNRKLLHLAWRGQLKDVGGLRGGAFFTDPQWNSSAVPDFTRLSREAGTTGQWKKAFQRLIRDGADIHAEDPEGNTPLGIAILGGFQQRVRLILEQGADPNHINHLGTTPLMFAASRADGDFTRLLLEHGADPNLPDKVGNAPLHYAAEHGSLDAANRLIAAGAHRERCNAMGQTPFYVAASKGYTKLAKTLFEDSVSVDQVDQIGLTALHRTTHCLEHKHLQFLLRLHADLESRDPAGNTPLMMAAMAGTAQAAQLLLHAGADHHAVNQARENALLLAAIHGNEPVVEALVKEGADLSSHVRGVNALMMAAANGHLATVKTLIELGADSASRDNEGQTALDHARANQHGQVADFLATL